MNAAVCDPPTQSVLLLLDGPMQSWGTRGRFGYRDTDREPSKSGVVGLVGAALGMSRDDGPLLERLAKLRLGVRVDRPGTILRDFHTAGGGTFRGAPHGVYGVKESGTVLTNRFYLADACFVAALSGTDEELLLRVARALQCPHWPLALGRRGCPPAARVFLEGPIAGDERSALRSVPWQGRRWAVPAERRMRKPVKNEGELPPLRCVVEAPDGTPRRDVPLAFTSHSRSFATRFVRDEWIPFTELPGDQNASQPPTAQPSLPPGWL